MIHIIFRKQIENKFSKIISLPDTFGVIFCIWFVFIWFICGMDGSSWLTLDVRNGFPARPNPTPIDFNPPKIYNKNEINLKCFFTW
jgi:hypothetical protein